ncbi:hypothetical protein GF391_03775 [Candidatus Uhrbacteria bacterium]|nr:hypothetical protein [Candidatus Uhrbacteria bacterium]
MSKYALPKAYALALASLMDEIIDEVVRGQKTGVVSEVAFRIELHIEKIFAEADYIQDEAQMHCASLLLDLFKYSAIEKMNVRQWIVVKSVIESWYAQGDMLTESNVEKYRHMLEKVDLEIHSRDSYIRAMDEENAES